MSIMNIREPTGSGQPKRFNRAQVVSILTIPLLQSLRKDYKGNIDGDPKKGPKLRPLAAFNRVPNNALINLMARVTKAADEKFSSNNRAEIISSKVLMWRIGDTNSDIEKTGREM